MTLCTRDFYQITARILALSIVLSSIGCNQQGQVPQYQKAPVTNLATAPVTIVTRPNLVAFDGTIEAINKATVSAQTGGQVTELAFDVGDYVAKGERVASITSVQQSARLKNAQSQLKEAEVRSTEAERAFNRAKSVFDKKLISQADFDKANSELNAANARLSAALANVKNTQENLNYTRINAPYAGIVLERHVQIGEVVSPGTALITGLSLQQLRVAVDIPQRFIGALRTGSKASVTLHNQQTIAVTNIRFPPSANPSTHSFRVLLDLPPGNYNTGHEDKTSNLPGTLVKVTFAESEVAEISVPLSAILRRGELAAVYVVNAKGILSMRYVRLGRSYGNDVSILAGLNSEETIALEANAAVQAYLNQNKPSGAT